MSIRPYSFMVYTSATVTSCFKTNLLFVVEIAIFAGRFPGKHITFSKRRFSLPYSYHVIVKSIVVRCVYQNILRKMGICMKF